tara:strand:+ start:233 stop:838 length:606 start_codon:yes stop_codon:yes gene_type:complete
MEENKKLIDIIDNPYPLFAEWFDQAKHKEINDPNAMNLATISEDSKISSRMVLLKSFDETGFVFYSNENSKKGRSILFNSNVAINFHWKSLRKQVRIEGRAEKISDDEADKYFNTRPEESKIGAWASSQSKQLQSRKELEDKILDYKNIYQKKPIPRPPYWVGYKINPLLFEFWQEMSFRLHDRVQYKKTNNAWEKNRLYP